MPFRINVELKNGAVCHMGKKAFNVFLSLKEVARFKRSDGWVDVEKDPLRDAKSNYVYPFADRRDVF